MKDYTNQNGQPEKNASDHPGSAGSNEPAAPMAPAGAILPDIVGRIMDGFFALDTDWQYSYMNNVAGEMLQLDPQTVIGQLIWNKFPMIMGEPFYNASRNAMTHQQYDCLEDYAAAKDSWIEYHLYPSPTGLSVLFRDITKRKMTELALKKTELRYRALFEQASDAIMITDHNGDFLDVNTSLCKMFGYTKEELMGANIGTLIDPEELRTDPIQFKAILAGQPILRERRMLHRDGTIIEVEANVKLIPDGRVLAIARDITERKKAALQIVKEKEISDSIINSLPGVFLIRELGGKILRWNRQLETISGYSGKEIAELEQFTFIEEKDKEHVRQRVKILLAEGRSASEITAITKDGTRIPFYITGIVIQFEGKICLMIMGIDISERVAATEELQRANEQLHHLSAYLQNVREEERTGIAREIHDELGQQLTGLKMDISWAMKKANETELVQEKLSAMSRLVDQTIATVRRISSELRPSILDDLGLSDALDWQSTEFQKRYSIEARFQSRVAELQVSPNLVTGLFRIYQESLTNVARHAEAKKVDASLRLVDNNLVLEVSDDGKGFDTETAGAKKTFGLMGIRERTLMMGGTCTILSSRNKGTTVTISVPMVANH
jgi:PAS domain S-box-containing protein